MASESASTTTGVGSTSALTIREIILTNRTPEVWKTQHVIMTNVQKKAQCKAQQNQNPEAGQTSMGRDGQIFMYNPDLSVRNNYAVGDANSTHSSLDPQQQRGWFQNTCNQDNTHDQPINDVWSDPHHALFLHV
ncbi:hypothetical protein Tco_0572273 [Tanacetum coccineum]